MDLSPVVPGCFILLACVSVCLFSCRLHSWVKSHYSAHTSNRSDILCGVAIPQKQLYKIIYCHCLLVPASLLLGFLVFILKASFEICN